MRVLALELGSWSVKAVEMESRFRRFEILDFYEVRLPLQMLDSTGHYRQATQQIMARLPSHPEKVVCSLPASQVSLRFLKIPVKQRKQVEKMFRFELEDNVPFKLGETILEHHVSRIQDQSLVCAAMAPKRLIFSHLQWLASIGVDPDWLTFDGMGLINLFLSQTPSEEKTLSAGGAPVCVLDIGHTKTNVAIFSEQRLEMIRSLNWGGLNLTQAIASNLTLSPEDAERYKETRLDLGGGDADLPEKQSDSSVRRSALQSMTALTAEIHHTLIAYRNLYKVEVSELMITGGASETKGLASWLSENVHLPVSKFSPFENLSFIKPPQAENAHRFVEALGRGLVFIRKVPYLFNFRQQEAGKETSLNEIITLVKNPNVLMLARWVGVLVGILWLHVTIAGFFSGREAKLSEDELRKVFSQTFPSVNTKVRNQLTTSPSELIKFINQKNKELENRLKLLSENQDSALTTLREVTNCFSSGVRVDVNVFDLTENALRIEGVLYSGNIEDINQALKKLAWLKNVQLETKAQRFVFRGSVSRQ